MGNLLTEKQKYWADQLKLAEQSGTSLADYARENNIPPQKLYQWRNVFKKQTTTSVTMETQFTQVIQPALVSNTLTVHLPTAELCFSTLPDATWLAQLLSSSSVRR